MSQIVQNQVNLTSYFHLKKPIQSFLSIRIRQIEVLNKLSRNKKYFFQFPQKCFRRVFIKHLLHLYWFDVPFPDFCVVGVTLVFCSRLSSLSSWVALFCAQQKVAVSPPVLFVSFH